MQIDDQILAVNQEKQSLKQMLINNGFDLTNIPLTQYHALFNLLNCDYYISPTGSDSNDGKTRSTPFLTLTKAINTANTGQNIGVLPGIYKGTSNCSFSITKGLNIYGAPGAFFDGENTRRSGWTLGAQDATYIINIHDITFQNGSNSNYSSGGLFAWVGGNINHCQFLNNTAKYGGGMYSAGPVILNNCIFRGNQAKAYGAGLFRHTSSSGSINQCTFDKNIAAEFGGGIYNGGTGSLLNCILSNNIAGDTQSGGGIYTNNLITLNNCFVVGNKAGFGGGIYNNNTGNIQDCTIINNTSITKGGGVCLNKESQIVRTLFNNNTSEYGGGIYNNSTGVVTSCVFSHNIGSYGGAMYNAVEGIANNCIFISNIASSSSNAIYNVGAANVIGCTFANNGDNINNYYTIYNFAAGMIKNCDFLKLHAWNIYTKGAATVDGCYWIQSKDGTPYRTTLKDGVTATGGKTSPNFIDRLSNMQLSLSNTTEVVTGGTKVILTAQLQTLTQDPLENYVDFYQDGVFIKTVLTNNGTATLDITLPSATTTTFDVRYDGEDNLNQIISNIITITTT